MIKNSKEKAIIIKRVTCVLFTVIIVFSAATGCSQEVAVAENPNAAISYDTPEKAVQAFFDAVSANDFDVVIRLFPIEKMAKNFDFIKCAELKYPPVLFVAPSNYDYFEKANVNIGKGKIANQLIYFCTSFSQSNDAKEFIKESDPLKLKEINVLSIDKPDRIDSEEAISNFNKNREVYGAEEVTERTALIEYNGKTYLAEFTLINYGGNWGIQMLTSLLANTSTQGRLSQITEEEYHIILSGIE